MSLVGTIAVVITAVVGIFAVLVLVGVARLRTMRNKNLARIAAVGDAELTAQAGFFGQASHGKTQTRGLGTLMLTKSELVFVQLVPARELRVARDAITSTRVTRHFLGKTQGRDLLVVMWDAYGMGDAAAFDVADTSAWTSQLS